MFYGSGAIGGVINVIDNRVPTVSDTLAEWLLQYNDVSDEEQGSLLLQTGSEHFAVHVDAFWRDGQNYKLPSDFDAHAFEEEEEHEEHVGEEETASHLENSASKSHGVTVGASYLFDQGFIGFSYGNMSRDYGIPGHAHHEEEEHDEANEIEAGTQAQMKQDRVQLLSEVNVAHNVIKQLAAKFAYTDYQHKEIEEGVVGTTFFNESYEAKIDLYHQAYSGWQGAWTLHAKRSEFSAYGDEAFAPPSTTDNFALAWLEEKHYGDVLLQLGVRIERVTIDADDSLIGFMGHEEEGEEYEDELELVSFKQQRFTPISASAGLVWDYQRGYNIGVSLAASQRAPSAAELFSFGPHIGANTFEVGAMFDLSLEQQGGDEIQVELSSQVPEIETSYSLDLTWRKFEGDFGFVVSAFYNQVKDYYYQQDSGFFFVDAHELGADVHEDRLPILVYQQGDVDMYGGEVELFYQLSSPIKVTLFGDYIHAKLSDGNFLPRTPPMRIGSSLNYQGDHYDSEFSVNHYVEQNDTAPLETSTPAYTLVDINFNYYLNDIGLDGMGSDIVLYIKGQNLTDEVAQVHSSFLKEIAPLPGRNFSLGIRGSF